MAFMKFKQLFSLPLQWAVLLSVYAAVVATIIIHHQPWFDEAQSWLLARDLSLPSLLFHWIRYEGTPPLWQFILYLANCLHLPYSAMSWIAGLIAVSGIFVFLKFSPFPTPVKVLLPFSYFFLYQYAAVARSYVLLPLLAFLAAALYRRGEEHTVAFCATLILLAGTSAHGAILSMGIAGSYSFDATGNWVRWDAPIRRRHLFAMAIYALAMLAIAVMVWPPADGNFLPPSHTELAGAQLAFSGAFVNRFGVSIVVLFLCFLWCVYRRTPLAFLLPLSGLVVFFARVYVNLWHHGVITICVVTAVWIAWSSDGERDNQKGFGRLAQGAVSGALAIVFAVQIPWAVAAVAYEMRWPYSGAHDAAVYLKAVGAGRQRTYAYGFSSVAILPYFQEQIFANQANTEKTTFWRWRKGNNIDAQQWRIAIERPDYLVVSIKPAGRLVPDVSPEIVANLTQLGYSLVHVSHGALFWKTAPWETDSYLIFHRAL
jgi:hypothetical protein